MIHVIATIELRPGTRPAFAAEFAQLAPAVRAEEGCLYYAGGVDLPTEHKAQIPIRPDVFVVVERWASPDSLAAHAVAAHVHAWRERAKPYMVRTTIQVLEPAGEPA